MHNVMRQALAISMVFASLPFIYKKENIKFAFTMFAAYMVHASAIVFVPFYFLSRLYIKPVLFFVAWLLSLPFIVIPGLVYFLIFKLEFVIPGIYSHYLLSQQMYEAGGLSGFGLVFLLKQLFFILFLLAYNKGVNNKQTQVVYNLSMLGIILGNFSLHLGLMARFTDYFLVFSMLALPSSVEIFGKSYIHCIKFLLFIILFGLYLYTLFQGGHGVAL